MARPGIGGNGVGVARRRLVLALALSGLAAQARAAAPERPAARPQPGPGQTLRRPDGAGSAPVPSPGTAPIPGTRTAPVPGTRTAPIPATRAAPAPAPQATSRPAGPLPLVVLDPGHGGRDPGTIGTAGTLEKRVTLAAAIELKRQLERSGRVRVALTRSRDVFVPLGARIDMARQRDAALFLSLHADSAPGARGASVYTLSETASDSLAAGLARRENLADRAGGLALPSVPPEVQRILLSLMKRETRSGSEKLARLTVQALDGEVTLLPNSHRRAAFVVLKAPDVPAALVEMGFLSHPADEAALNRPQHRMRVATALTEAVLSYLATRQSLAT